MTCQAGQHFFEAQITCFEMAFKATLKFAEVAKIWGWRGGGGGEEGGRGEMGERG